VNIAPVRSRTKTDVVAIACGGAVGVLVRIAAGELWPIDGGMPWATLFVNVAGAAFLGVVATLPLHTHGFGYWRFPLLATGFCGALTTFSGICWEFLDLTDHDKAATAFAYLGLSLVLGLVGAAGASAVTGRLVGQRSVAQ